jgi:hypothetical protein
MKLIGSLLIIVAVIFGSGCCTTPANDQPHLSQVLSETFGPIYDMRALRSGAMDLLYCSASFQNKNGRWPNNYPELQSFVKESNGYLLLGDYQQVDLTPLANGGLELAYVRTGATNKVKFTFTGPSNKK